MLVKIAADIHGEVDALIDQLDPKDTLILLGDYINLLDFSTFDGILAQIVSKEEIKQVLDAIARGDMKQAKILADECMGKSGAKQEQIQSLLQESYLDLFNRIPCRTYLLYGNLDQPGLLQKSLPDHCIMLDGEVRKIGGKRFGFLSGSTPSKWTFGLPGEVPVEIFRERLEGMKDVDILCAHYPPAIRSLTYDVRAKRDEQGSEEITEWIRKVQPSYVFFGHVHNPLRHRLVLDNTILINTGYFRRQKKIYHLNI